MRVPLDWLAEKFAGRLDRSAIATALFESGFELEAADWVRPGLETVVTGRILTCERHPDADRLRICTVDVGEPLQIVTAAANVQTGDIVPVALVGSHLPTGKEIGLSKLRGVESQGMFCSAIELGMAPENEADASVLVLPEQTAVGRSIASVLELGDCVLDVAVTANRGDGLSVTGLARALAAAGLGELAPAPAPAPAAGGQPSASISVTLEDPDLCPRYTAQIVTGVHIGPSPAWLVRRLELAGIRAINSAVDVTNYVMLDVGQPLHAFDLARIDPATIAVRRARPGERIHTLDDVSRDLPEGTLVVADANGLLAIAGVMGGAASAVSQTTTDVLLESAYFKPSSVRLTARALDLSSESSYRFERGVDPLATAAALAQAAALLAEIAGGRPLAGPTDVRQPGFPQPQVVPLRPERTARILGCAIEPDRQAALLASLGFVERTGQTEYADGMGRYQNARWFEVPGWRRHDVTREIDLIEEISQRHGYGAIPDTLPPLERLPAPGIAPADRLRTLLQGFGFWEVLTNSVVPAHSQEGFVYPGEAPIALANPLGEMQVMRASLLPGLLEVARTNLNRGAERVLVYDMGRIYRESPQGRRETPQVAALAVGAVADGMWKHPPAAFEADFFWAKGVACNALTALGLADLEAIPDPSAPGWHPGRVARFVSSGSLVGACGGRVLATFGELHPERTQGFDLPAHLRTSAVVFDLEAIAACLDERGTSRFEPFSRFPASQRDLALVLDDTLCAGAIARSARQAGGALLEDVRIFDRYSGPQVPPGKVSLALNLRYRAPDRTLTDADVDALHREIVGTLCQQFGASLRG